MGKIVDYPCPAGRDHGIHEAAALSTEFRFPEAYEKGEDMAKISCAVRSFYNDPFCTLPFCNTVEGEAMGGIVEYGDGSSVWTDVNTLDKKSRVKIQIISRA